MLRLLSFITLLMTSACATTPMGSPRSAIVDGNSIQYVVSAGKRPTVVFESGLGDGYKPWATVALSNGKLIVSSGSGHYIQRDAPNHVLLAIKQILSTTKPDGIVTE